MFALAGYSLDNTRHFEFQNVEVMVSETYYQKTTVLEMLHIEKDINLVNNWRDIQNLSDIYNSLMSFLFCHC